MAHRVVFLVCLLAVLPLTESVSSRRGVLGSFGGSTVTGSTATSSPQQRAPGPARGVRRRSIVACAVAPAVGRPSTYSSIHRHQPRPRTTTAFAYRGVPYWADNALLLGVEAGYDWERLVRPSTISAKAMRGTSGTDAVIAPAKADGVTPATHPHKRSLLLHTQGITTEQCWLHQQSY